MFPHLVRGARRDDLAAQLAGAGAEVHEVIRLLHRLLVVLHDDVARESLTAALESRPNSQSATLALASLELRRGDADAAHARAEAALAERARDDDPWRLFLYGRYPTMTKLIDDLRAAVRR